MRYVDCMQFFDLTLPSLEENLALEEALLLAAEAGQGGEVLRFWEWPRHAVVLGSGGKLLADVDLAACETDHITVARRSSGGGTVLLGPGCLLFTLVLDYGRHPALGGIGSSYQYVLRVMADGLGALAPGAIFAGTSDLSIGGRKFSGNSQQRKQRFMLHHGTLLYDFDLQQVGRYLHMPERQPEYRAHRAHQDFIMNLTGKRSELIEALANSWHACAEPQAWHPAKSYLPRLAAQKYSQATWLNKR
jgi:lipoate-protein ligase A